MKLLIDQNLPQRLALLLKAEGHDATHTEDVGMATSSDPPILSWCCAEERMLITADKKLTKFLASSGADCPSVLVTREMRTLLLDQFAPTLSSSCRSGSEARPPKRSAEFIRKRVPDRVGSVQFVGNCCMALTLIATIRLRNL